MFLYPTPDSRYIPIRRDIYITNLDGANICYANCTGKVCTFKYFNIHFALIQNEYTIDEKDALPRPAQI